MKTHDLKIWPVYFDAVASGDKTFEFRRNDRDFQHGDILHLREYDPVTEEYTGRDLHVLVTYILTGVFDLQENAIMSIKRLYFLEPHEGFLEWMERESVMGEK